MAESIEALAGSLEDVLNRIGVPGYVIDPDGTIRWLNRAGRDLLGDVRGQKFTTVVAPEDTLRARQFFARKLFSGGATDFGLDLLRADGRRVHVDISSAAIRRNGDVVGVFGLMHAADDGDGPTPGQAASSRSLTPRQTEVLRLLAGGASTAQIAEGLHLSPETVRNHVRHVLRALNAHSRLEAVARARGDGLVD